MSAEQQTCQACDALPGMPCRWDCIGLASELDRLEEAAGVVDAHCLICQAATPKYGSHLIARAMTVETSKLYAALHYRAQLDAL